MIINPPLEALSLNWQQGLDICTATEDAIQVHPSTLHINPHIKHIVDAVQLLFPLKGILFKHLLKTCPHTQKMITLSENKDAVMLGNFSCNLSCNFVAPL